MFFSIEHLISRDSKFAIVWRIATTHSPKRIKAILTRKQAQSVNISEICQSLLRHLPSGKGTHEELQTKFSLYLLGQLLFGTAIILERQTELLEADVRAAYESCQRFNRAFFEVNVDGEIDKKPSKKIKGRKSLSTAECELNDRNIHFDSLEELDGQARHVVTVALRNHITLDDPVAWRRPDPFAYDDDLMPPTDAELKAMNSFAVISRSSSNHDSNHVAMITSAIAESGPARDIKDNEELINESVPQDLSHPQGREISSPLIPPTFMNLEEDRNLEEMNREPELSVNLDFAKGVPSTPIDEQHVLDLNENGTGRMLLEDLEPHAHVIDAENKVSVVAAVDLSDVPTHHTPLKRSLDLEELNSDVLRAITPAKRRRKRRINIDYGAISLKIPMEEMRLMQDPENYASLLREKVVNLEIRPPCELISIEPMWPRSKVPADISRLYRAVPINKLSMDDAARLDVFEELDRGSERQLWRFEETQDNGCGIVSREKSPGIAFLCDVNRRINGGEELELSGRGNLRDQNQLQTLDGNSEIPPIDVEPQPQRDERDSIEIRRQSKLSELFADQYDTGRRSTLLFDEAEGRELAGGAQCGRSDYTLNAGRCSPPASYVDDRRQELAQIVKEGAHKNYTFQDLFPFSYTRKTAARAFSVLLEVLKFDDVTAEQLEPYGAIILHSASMEY